MLVILLSACGDRLERNNPVNKGLDTKIADRLYRLRNLENVCAPFDFEKAHRVFTSIAESISLADASISLAYKADGWFSGCALTVSPLPVKLKKISGLDKPEAITAIKQNELILLEHLLSYHQK